MVKSVFLYSVSLNAESINFAVILAQVPASGNYGLADRYVVYGDIHYIMHRLPQVYVLVCLAIVCFSYYLCFASLLVFFAFGHFWHFQVALSCLPFPSPCPNSPFLSPLNVCHAGYLLITLQRDVIKRRHVMSVNTFCQMAPSPLKQRTPSRV